MSTRYVNIDRSTPMLLPPDIREWVQQDDLAHFLVDAVQLMDFSAASRNERGTGNAQYPPAMMFCVLVYCYAQGIFSSRQIERATYQHLSVRYLAADTHPDHDTIAKFRRENGPLMRSAFVQLLQLARRSGLLNLGTVALDGTKLEAATHKRRTLTRDQLEAELARLDVQVGELLERAEAADRQEAPADALPAELARAQTRRARLLAAREELQEQTRQRQEQREQERQEAPPGGRPRSLPREPRSTDTINPTDPDSTLTPTAQQRYIQGYNAQVAVGVEEGLIVAVDVVRDTNDTRQLQPMVEQTLENGLQPHRVLVDSGYENTRQILTVEARHGLVVLCPPARTSRRPGTTASRGRWRQQCRKMKQILRERLDTAAGAAAYALRRETVEPVIGIIKSVLGFRRFRLRGLSKVQTEWCLVSLAFNCRRLAGRWA